MSALRHRLFMKATSLFMVAIMAFVTVGLNTGCYTQEFQVGSGGTTGESQEFRQWFALWGLLPITDVQDDVESYYAGASDFTVTTQFTPLDILIGIFTGIVTIQPKTVTVTR